jgi:hypothetical protein
MSLLVGACSERQPDAPGQAGTPQVGAPPEPAAQAGANPGMMCVPVEVAGAKYVLSGPYQHENLAVYLVHADRQDEQEFITLDEGLKSGQVKVTEQQNAQVNQLMIDNGSDKPLYLQEGDRVVGGKQDRIVEWCLVLPPKSGPRPLPAFCVEPHRWTDRGDGGGQFQASFNAALANLEVRQAAKYQNSQGEVWRQVAITKAGAAGKLNQNSSTSSLSETLDDAQVKKVSDDAAKALDDALAKNPDAVGVAIAVNGKVKEVDIYPGHKLLAKLYPRLVESYAVTAALNRDEPTRQPTGTPVAPGVNAHGSDRVLTAADVVAFLQTGPTRKERLERIDGDNRAAFRDFEGKADCTNSYNGKNVLYQMMEQPTPGGGVGDQRQAPSQRNMAPNQAPPNMSR